MFSFAPIGGYIVLTINHRLYHCQSMLSVMMIECVPLTKNTITPVIDGEIAAVIHFQLHCVNKVHARQVILIWPALA